MKAELIKPKSRDSWHLYFIYSNTYTHKTFNQSITFYLLLWIHLLRGLFLNYLDNSVLMKEAEKFKVRAAVNDGYFRF